MSDSVVLNQDDPAGSYVTFTADATKCFPGVPRSPIVAPIAAGEENSPGIDAELIDSITVEEDGTYKVVVNAAKAGAGSHNKPYLAPMALNGRRIVVGPPIPGADSGGVTVTHPPRAIASGYPGAGGTALPQQTASYTVTKVGNSVLCFIAYDPAGGDSIASVSTESNGAFTLLELLTVGGTYGYKLATYILKNAQHVVTQDVLVTNAIHPEMFAHAAIATCEINSGFTDPSDATTTATGSDAFPITAASADTVAANEVFVSALLVSGGATAAPAALADNTNEIAFDQDGNRYVQSDTTFTLYVYQQNVIAIGNYGFSCTLATARDWAIATHSFK